MCFVAISNDCNTLLLLLEQPTRGGGGSVRTNHGLHARPENCSSQISTIAYWLLGAPRDVPANSKQYISHNALDKNTTVGLIWRICRSQNLRITFTLSWCSAWCYRWTCWISGRVIRRTHMLYFFSFLQQKWFVVVPVCRYWAGFNLCIFYDVLICSTGP